MSHSVVELCQRFTDLVIDSRNNQCEFETVDSTESFTSDSLIFVSDQSGLPDTHQTAPAVIVTDGELAQKIQGDQCVVIVNNVRLAQALIKQAYQDIDVSDPEWDSIHASSVIHSSAKLGENVRIGANTVIGAGVVIGDRTQVRANCVIEREVMIGADCIINNLVNIGLQCQLGDRVIVRAGATIGGEGFGFAQDEARHYHRVPHTGNVVIGDDVQIGANCNIDRATYGSTLIKRGVKIDALCHIAHNCTVGEDVLIVAQSGLAGSCDIGDRVICSGQTGMLDHRTVAADAVLVHRCGVTEDIPSAGVWAGTPPKPFKEYVANLNAAKRLERKLAKLQEKVDSLNISDTLKK